ncbi:MAG: hypothetical protein LAP38_09890 [Acidobacteriia bacterium]|nr:hypothetical protein [Terriglobia bacterium]
MRLILIRSAILAVALVIAWVLAGRRLALLLDRLVTVGAASLPVSPLQYDGGGFRIGGLAMTFGGLDNLRVDLRLSTDASNRVTLETAGQSFTLGPRTSGADPSGRPEFDFASEADDRVSFTTSRSALGWPTPFEFNIMIRHSPWWRRHVYYRLAWEKRSGAKLEMFWRYEQSYYAAGGWTQPEMLWNSRTGLVRVDITPAHGNVVAEYIARHKGWKPGEYRIEERGPSAGGSSDVIAVIYLEDQRSPQPGAGQSVELWVDRASGQVVKELGGQ